jgi:primosomal protein N''
MTAQPEFDFTPLAHEENVSVAGLEDFLEEQAPPPKSESANETQLILRLMDQLIQAHQFLEIAMRRVGLAQDRLDMLQFVMTKQAEQIAVIPYYQHKVLELEQRLARCEADKTQLENHWLRRLFFWIR